MKRSSQMTPNP